MSKKNKNNLKTIIRLINEDTEMDIPTTGHAAIYSAFANYIADSDLEAFATGEESDQLAIAKKYGVGILHTYLNSLYA